MFNKKTVLILGAGASIPYHFPSGKGLIHEIIHGQHRGYDSLIKSYLPRGISVERFRSSLHKSKPSSIDTFLEKNPTLIDAGKIAIASVLLPREREDFLFNAKPGDDWYTYLNNLLSEQSFEDFGKNLSIITFNYDRSLEHSLYTHLTNLHLTEKTSEECVKQLRTIPIIHVYGKLGNLPWKTDDKSASIPYGGNLAGESDDIRYKRIEWVAKSIKIIPESHNTAKEQQKKINELINNAEKIFFLGFGFHSENLRRINLDSFNFGDVKATTYGLPNDRLKELLKFKTKENKYILAAPSDYYSKRDGTGALFPKTVGQFVHEVGLK
jgi:hypothetical protein